MNRFEGRVAFVTGAGHGIGRATVHRLAREGASVAVADIDDEAARGVAEVVTSAGGQAFAITCDVTNVASVDAAVAACAERFGHLDVLVQTAGGDTEEPAFHDTPDAVWQRMVDLNLLGTVRCIRSAIPHLLPSAFGGCVVMIGSVNGLSAFGSFPYSSAKAGLGILTKNLAAEYGHQGVRFNLIAPGTIRTRVWDSQPPSSAWPGSTRLAALASRMTLPPLSRFSPRMTRRGSPASPCRWRAASSPGPGRC
jgi:NAD(P)-dependent dehydrogenase (short-subunit alcohol dehydrogenase family)